MTNYSEDVQIMWVCLQKHFSLAQQDASEVNIPIPTTTNTHVSHHRVVLESMHCIALRGNKTRRCVPVVNEFPAHGMRLELAGSSPSAYQLLLGTITG